MFTVYSLLGERWAPLDLQPMPFHDEDRALRHLIGIGALLVEAPQQIVLLDEVGFRIIGPNGESHEYEPIAVLFLFMVFSSDDLPEPDSPYA